MSAHTAKRQEKKVNQFLHPPPRFRKLRAGNGGRVVGGKMTIKRFGGTEPIRPTAPKSKTQNREFQKEAKTEKRN